MDPEEASASATCSEGKVTSAFNNTAVSGSNQGKTPNNVDKLERIERYVRMTIQNQAESMLARNNVSNVSFTYLHL